MRDLQATKGFTLVELLTVIAIVGLLAAVALRSYQPAVAKAGMFDAFASGGEARMRVHEHYAMTGRWLDAGGDSAEEVGYPPKKISIDRGAVSVVFDSDQAKRLGGDTLTLRPAVAPKGEGLALVWSCGSGAIPAGLSAQGEDRTNIPPAVLPGLCR